SAGWKSVLCSVQPDSGSRILRDSGGWRPGPFFFLPVFSFPFGRGGGGDARRAMAAGGRPAHRGCWGRIIPIPRHRRQLLEHFFPTGGRAGFRDGGERCASNDNGDERGAEK